MPIHGDRRYHKALRSLLTISLAAFLLSIPISYMLLGLYLDVGRTQEALLLIIVSSFLSGFVFWGEESLLSGTLAVFFSEILALLIGSWIVAYPLIISGSHHQLRVLLFLQEALPIALVMVLPISLILTFIGLLSSGR